jgi:hypothetical protein
MSGSNPAGTYTITLVPPVQSVAPGLGCTGTGPFAGWPIGQVQQALANAQAALVACVTGAQAVTVNYAEGQGHREVTYNRSNADDLRVLIRDLQAAMGIKTRGSVWPRFG